MDVNKNMRDYTTLHLDKIKVKEQCFYCCSTLFLVNINDCEKLIINFVHTTYLVLNIGQNVWPVVSSLYQLPLIHSVGKQYVSF
jgi:hypothetical protein